MPTTLSSDRYSAVSSTSSTTTYSSSSSTSSNSSSNNTKINNSQSQLSSTFIPLRSATSSIHLSKITNTNSRSMQSLQLKNPSTPVARISPIVINQNLFSNEFDKKQETWISCDELETIEKRFNDLLYETKNEKKSPPIILNNYQQRSNSCDRLLINKEDEEEKKDHSNTLIYDNNTNQQTFVLSANDILKVESSYRSIGTQVFACRCLCDLYITTIERLSKLEDWIPFHQGLPVWLLNSGTNEKRQTRLSLILAEHGSGFPIWQDTINGLSNVKQTRPQHMTFTLSDQVTLAVLRFRDLSASKEFYSIYKSISNDKRYEYLFSKHSLTKSHRSSSCGSLLKKRRKIQKHISKSSISNPCQFQHITSVQLKDRHRLISLDQCLVPPSNKH